MPGHSRGAFRAHHGTKCTSGPGASRWCGRSCASSVRIVPRPACDTWLHTSPCSAKASGGGLPRLHGIRCRQVSRGGLHSMPQEAHGALAALAVALPRARRLRIQGTPRCFAAHRAVLPPVVPPSNVARPDPALRCGFAHGTPNSGGPLPRVSRWSWQRGPVWRPESVRCSWSRQSARHTPAPPSRPIPRVRVRALVGVAHAEGSKDQAPMPCAARIQPLGRCEQDATSTLTDARFSEPGPCRVEPNPTRHVNSAVATPVPK